MSPLFSPYYSWDYHRPEWVAVDTETTGVEYFSRPFLVTASFRAKDGEMLSYALDLENPQPYDVTDWKHFLAVDTVEWVGHNLKFDWHMLAQAGLVDYDTIEWRYVMKQCHDTSVMYHLLDENDRKGLKYLAQKYLADQIPMTEVEKKDKSTGALLTVRVPTEDYELAEARKKLGMKKTDGYHRLPRELVKRYGMKDTEYTLLLFERFRQALYDKDLWDVYQEEMLATRALLRMERRGFGIDVERLDSLTSQYGMRVIELEGRLREMAGDAEFNPGSTQQITAVLKRRGHAVPNTQADTLRGMDDEFARLLTEYRDAQKTHATYLLGLKREQREGEWHPSFNPTGARTGRLSSSTGGL